jgi:transcriptional regulator with XRE-family HTH domain
MPAESSSTLGPLSRSYRRGMTGGDLIVMARRRAGLTQRELGERVGCEQATIACWERGEREPSWEDVGAVARGCGLQVEAHLVGEDRSRWGDVAVAITLSPAERVRRVLAPEDDVFGPANVIPVLERLGESGEPAIVIGDVAGALHGWPLEISGSPVEVCAVAEGASSLVAGLGARPDTRWEMPGLAEALAEQGVVRTRKITEEPFVLPGGGRVLASETLPGTAGFADLARNAEPMAVGGRTVLVASLLDLLRIADALISEPAPKREDPDEHPYLVEERNRKSLWRQTNARYDALALRAVLDVRAAKQAAWEADDRSDEQKLEAWASMWFA